MNDFRGEMRCSDLFWPWLSQNPLGDFSFLVWSTQHPWYGKCQFSCRNATSFRLDASQQVRWKTCLKQMLISSSAESSGPSPSLNTADYYGYWRSRNDLSIVWTTHITNFFRNARGTQSFRKSFAFLSRNALSYLR